jgi:high-affinity iron transporter
LLGALIIVLREVIEAGLIVGIVLAATQGIPARMRYILAGLGGGLLGSGVVAFFAGRLSAALDGNGQEIFNAAILAVAVVMLAWHTVWMARHGREMAAELKQVGQAVRTGSRSLGALAVVVGVAVLREGSEVVLFLYGLAISSGSTAGLLVGGLLGLAGGVAISAVTFLGLVRIPLGQLFKVTGLLLTFMAAGLAAQSVAFLEQADLATVLGRPVWNSAWLLKDSSMVGIVLHTLLGYSDRPTGLQLLVYLLTLAVIFLLMRLVAPTPRLRHQAAE